MWKLARTKFFLMLALVFLTTSRLNAAVNTVEVYGTAKLTIQPDVLVADLMLEQAGPLLSKLQMQIEQDKQHVINILNKVDNENIAVSVRAPEIFSNYQASDANFYKFAVRQYLSISIINYQEYAILIDKLNRVSSLSFVQFSWSTLNKTQHLELLLGMAIENARQKAVVIAEKTGVKLNKVVQVEELSDVNKLLELSPDVFSAVVRVKFSTH